MKIIMTILLLVGLAYSQPSFLELQNNAKQAEKEMSAQVRKTSRMSATVTLALFNTETKEREYVTIPKSTFLSRRVPNLNLETDKGNPVTVKVVWPNGINTPVNVSDPYIPLTVRYPRNGKNEFYVSHHPKLINKLSVMRGRIYLERLFEDAWEELVQDGYIAQPISVEMAKALAVVEHIDHHKFKTLEYDEAVREVYVLYAYNRGRTYNFSMSRAKAGGMIQMIPSTYAGIRRIYSHVPLERDFLKGMRDHRNAAKAMLLYIDDVWYRLRDSESVQEAIKRGDSMKRFLAAGYNSNPVRLPRYVARGGDNWDKLLPRETKTYLKITAEQIDYLTRVE